jgi:asparagine synthase (glutamine-hydrolysing)
VTVLLDGQGADEALAGYHPYFNVVADDLFRRLRLPAYASLRGQYKALHGRPLGSVTAAARQSVPQGLKRPLKSLLRRGGDGANGHDRVEPFAPEYPADFKNVSALRKILWWHTTRQGLVELLRYADRNSMAHSREVRLPFLDHRLVEYVFTLPDEMIIRGGWTKWVLRRAFDGVVPAAIANRVDKLGYEPPQRDWLGGRSWKDLMIGQVEARAGSLAADGVAAATAAAPRPPSASSAAVR